MLEKRFAAGQTIFSEGDQSDCAYVIRSGRVEILKATAHGMMRLNVLGEGDVLGEMGLLEERPRSATAKALDAVVAEAISPGVFVRLLMTEPKRSMHLLRALFERLRTANQMAIELSQPAASVGPRVTLIPLTQETRAALPADGLQVPRLPFRVGRKPATRADKLLCFNDLQLADVSPYVLSLNHFSLDVGAEGVLVRDRGSQHGTMVNGTRIGAGARRDVAVLNPGENEVVAGVVTTPLDRHGYAFRFKVVVG